MQADHGSTYGIPKAADAENAHFDVYAAYYLPVEFELDIPDPFTAVNSFPMLLNALFDADIAMQADQLFVLPMGYDSYFIQQEVTQELLRKAAA